MKDFDFLGITIQYEMCYTNILQVLDLSGIPLHAKERDGGRSDCDRRRPVHLQSGAASQNFFDLFYIGEGETVYDPICWIFIRKYKQKGASSKRISS